MIRKWMTGAVMLITVGILSRSAAAPRPSRHQPIFLSVVEILQNNPTTGKPVQNIEEWLPLLPLELRSHFTFIYQSRSPHGDLGEKAVDPNHPRTVLFSPDGKVTLAFNGNPDKEGYNSIEMIEFIDDGARFEFSKFILPDGKATATKEALSEHGKVNPSSCLRCHGQDPRPITDSYPLWPGFYGSVRDTFPKNSPELPLYKKFLSEQKEKAPYRFLNWPTGTSVPPYLDPKLYNPNSKEGGMEKLKFLPNTQLGMAYTELNRKRIQRKLQTSPLYKSLRYGLLAGLLDCKTLPLSEKGIQKNYEALYYENADRLLRLGFLPEGPERKTLEMMELPHYENMAQIDYLANSLNLDRSDWSMAFETPSFSFFDGILSSFYDNKNYYMKEDFILEMFRELSLSDPGFQPFFKTYRAYDDDGFPFGERLDFQSALRGCGLLLEGEKNTRLPLPEYKERTLEGPLPEAKIFLEKAGLTEAPFKRCTECHEGPLSLLTGRKLPFNSPTELREVLSSPSRNGRLLFDEILTRVHSHGSEQMPPYGESLTQKETEQLENYLLAVLKY